MPVYSIMPWNPSSLALYENAIKILIKLHRERERKLLVQISDQICRLNPFAQGKRRLQRGHQLVGKLKWFSKNFPKPVSPVQHNPSRNMSHNHLPPKTQIPSNRSSHRESSIEELRRTQTKVAVFSLPETAIIHIHMTQCVLPHSEPPAAHRYMACVWARPPSQTLFQSMNQTLSLGTDTVGVSPRVERLHRIGWH